jgi:twitching motility protein PilT
VHRDTKSFSGALRSALREDPDVILVGEMRDLETIRLALTAVETGHLVLSTLHTASASKTIDRIINVFPAEEENTIRFLFAESLRAVLSQILVKRKGNGVVAVWEILIANMGIRTLIREGKSHQIYSAIQMGQNIGMQTQSQHLEMLIDKGIVDPEDVKPLLQKEPSEGYDFDEDYEF